MHWHWAENYLLVDSILKELYWDKLSLQEQILGLTDLCSDQFLEKEG